MRAPWSWWWRNW